jgi:hypothetical protein
MLNKWNRSGFILAETIIALNLFCIGSVFLLEQNRYLQAQELQKKEQLQQKAAAVDVSFKLIEKSEANLTTNEKRLLQRAVE